jgi:hypothetical protein
VCIANKVASVIIYHHPFVECVVFENAILPTFLLSLQVVCEQADEVNHSGGCRRGAGSHDPEEKIEREVASPSNTSSLGISI